MQASTFVPIVRLSRRRCCDSADRHSFMRLSLRLLSRSMSDAIPLAPRKVDEDVWKYPRPPLLQRTPK